MHQIVYISSARQGTTQPVVEAILAASRRNNHRNGITGLLISDGTRFLQALEGDHAAVEATYARIKADPRHRAAVILSSKAISERQFGSWDMAFNGFCSTGAGGTLIGVVDQLVAHVEDRNLRALFTGFARIDRSNVA